MVHHDDLVAPLVELMSQHRADAAATHDHDMHTPTVAARHESAQGRSQASASVAPAYYRRPCSLTSIFKRALVGRPQSSAKLGETLLPKRIALPVFASDALSSNAYATQEILLVLSLGGVAFSSYTPWVAAASSWSSSWSSPRTARTCTPTPSGGGDYENVSVNLGSQRWGGRGERAARRLRDDGGGVDCGGRQTTSRSAFDGLDEHKVLVAVLLDRAHHLLEPARRPRVGNRVRDSDLCVHGCHLLDGRVGDRANRSAATSCKAESADWDTGCRGLVHRPGVALSGGACRSRRARRR